MDDLNIGKMASEYGWGVAVGLLALQWLPVFYKKWVSGSYISYKVLKQGMEKIEIKLNGHLEKEAQEDVMFATLKGDHANLKELVSTENGHIFGQLKSIHEKMDFQTNSINSKIDDLMKILLQKNGK